MTSKQGGGGINEHGLEHERQYEQKDKFNNENGMKL